MFDWNNNGRYDMQDSFIDYHIYKSVSGNKSTASSSGDGSDLLSAVGVGLLIFGILMILA